MEESGKGDNGGGMRTSSVCSHATCPLKILVGKAASLHALLGHCVASREEHLSCVSLPIPQRFSNASLDVWWMHAYQSASTASYVASPKKRLKTS